MKSFGKLLRKLRGQIPLEEIGRKAFIPLDYLRAIERGDEVADQKLAARILTDAFALSSVDTRRLLVGIELYDLGLRDPEIRQLVADVIARRTPPKVVEALRRLYLGYSEEPS